MYQKKLLAKTWRKNALFSLLLMFVKLVLLITFFCAFFHNFFNGFEISVKFCVFWHLYQFFQKKFFFVILVLFSNFEAKRARNGSKNQKPDLVNVSILHPSKGLYSLFSLKKSNSLYPTVQLLEVSTLRGLICLCRLVYSTLQWFVMVMDSIREIGSSIPRSIYFEILLSVR
jgi:hypothetical protein